MKIKGPAINGENELWKKVHPVLLHIYCRGVMNASRGRLMLSAIGNFVFLPIRLAIMILYKTVHLLILFALWWFFRDELAEYEALTTIVIGSALIVIFYKDIYEEVVFSLVNMLNFLTAGGFWRWMCGGYLSGTGFRQSLFFNRKVEDVVASTSQELPREYQLQYDRFFDLYFKSRKLGEEKELESLVEDYWKGESCHDET